MVSSYPKRQLPLIPQPGFSNGDVQRADAPKGFTVSHRPESYQAVTELYPSAQKGVGTIRVLHLVQLGLQEAGHRGPELLPKI